MNTVAALAATDWLTSSLSIVAVAVSVSTLAIVWRRGRLQVRVEARQSPPYGGLAVDRSVNRRLVHVTVTVTGAPATITELHFVRADGRPTTIAQHPWQLAVPDALAQLVDAAGPASSALTPRSDELPLLVPAGGVGRWTLWVREPGPIGPPHVGFPPAVELRPEVTLANGRRMFGPSFPAVLVDSTLAQPVDSFEEQ